MRCSGLFLDGVARDFVDSSYHPTGGGLMDHVAGPGNAVKSALRDLRMQPRKTSGIINADSSAYVIVEFIGTPRVYHFGGSLGVTWAMDSAQHCQDQAAECLRLMKLTQSTVEAEVLRNLASSWSRLAGQIDRYSVLVRQQGRIAQK
jgi:hypothetical protein